MSGLSLNSQDSSGFKIGLYFGVLILLVLLSYVCFRQFSQLQQLKSVYLSQINQLAELKQVLTGFARVQAQHQQNQEKINQLAGLIAHSQQTTQAAIALSSQLVESGMQIKLFQPGLSQIPNPFFNFQVLGSYQQLIEFLRINSSRWPLRSVQELNIVPEANTSGRLFVSGVIKMCGADEKNLSETAC